MTRRDRAEHEQGQAGNVQGAVQWYAGADRRGRRVAQRVERLPHGGFLAERQEAGPERRGPGHEGAPQSQRRARERHRSPLPAPVPSSRRT